MVAQYGWAGLRAVQTLVKTNDGRGGDPRGGQAVENLKGQVGEETCTYVVGWMDNEMIRWIKKGMVL